MEISIKQQNVKMNETSEKVTDRQREQAKERETEYKKKKPSTLWMSDR